jgi:calcineurin-like phosphoesterase family protein
MSKVFVTADLHLNHTNIIKYCGRPFSSVEDMNRTILDNWYSTISEEDTVYILGDFWWNPRKEYPLYQEFFTDMGYPGSPPGKKILIRGNHDKAIDEWLFDMVYDLYTISIDIGEGYPVPLVMSHYAMRVWDCSHYGSFHLFGHSHGTLDGYGRSIDVGVDTNEFKPYLLTDVVERLLDIDYRLTHGVGKEISK